MPMPSPLHSPLQAGTLKLSHRVTMSAMTRLRADDSTGCVTALMAKYYAQRASSGGLLITEGTFPTQAGKGYVRMPGIATQEQVASWRQVTDAVHAAGASIFCQLMHAGRVSHSSMQENGVLPVAPSAVKMVGKVHTINGKVDYETPRALESSELPGVAMQFAIASRNAIEAGFDGVELHGGNGYLLQSFLAEKTNQRDDEYGGSVENRARFVLEVIDACGEAIGFEKVGIKLQGGVTFSDLIESEDDVFRQLEYLGPELGRRGLAYVCMSSLNGAMYSSFAGLDKPNFERDVWEFFRSKYDGILMLNGGLTIEEAQKYVEKGVADLVAFAMMFLATPDLPSRISEGREPNMGGADPKIWYARPNFTAEEDARFYTDW